MKTYKIFIAAIIAIGLLPSCKETLQTSMVNEFSSNTYYKTPAEAYAALIGCYNGLDLVWNAGVAMPMAAEILSDNCLAGGGSSDGYGFPMIDEFNKTISPSDASQYDGNWQAYYQAIYRCNTLINNLDQVAFTDSTTTKNQYEAEAKFLRANFYFDMVRLWEKVPLVTVPTIANVPQSDPAITYAQIMSDLRFAITNLPSIPYSSTPSGRVTKWAAESMLARVYLFYSGYYGVNTIGGETQASALAALEDVISHSGHSLVKDFTTLWPAASEAKGVTYAGETNPEVVFSVSYTGNANYNGNITGSTWAVYFGIRLGAGGGTSIYPYGYGWGVCTVDPNMWTAYNDTDTRRFASITSVTAEGLDVKCAKITGKAFSSANNREYTGYYLKKYSPLCDTNNNFIPNVNYLIAQPQDYFVIRYADVLLMAAELGSPNALTYFNQVHTRANLAAVTSVAPAEILNERRFEFLGEGIRYWDLLRQGINTAAATIVANTSASYLSDGSATPSISASNIILTRGFQQIPATEITLSGGSLQQNPGW